MSLSTDSDAVNSTTGDIESGGAQETEGGKVAVPKNTEKDEESLDNTQINILSNEMICNVANNPLYVQCLLHIKAYRDYHKGEKDEFLERIEVIDERYSRFAKVIDQIQISIIVLSAVSAFVQAGNPLFGLSDVILQFIALCIASYSALVLSISKYFKWDEKKEHMNNLRSQCAELVGELGAREDRLNTLCAKEIWAAPPGENPPAVEAWENERDEMFTTLKSIILKKQNLVTIFDHLMDSNEAKELILSAKKKTLYYKDRKLSLDNDFLDYAEKKLEQTKRKIAIYGERKIKPSDMTMVANNGMYGATPQSIAYPAMQRQGYNLPHSPRRRHASIATDYEIRNNVTRANEALENAARAKELEEALIRTRRDNDEMYRDLKAMRERERDRVRANSTETIPPVDSAPASPLGIIPSAKVLTDADKKVEFSNEAENVTLDVKEEIP